ncbi:hypothetical protein [Streptomyces sp. S.PNR 29]|uniref:hypothetical protein n=1 Tax=Streptomyces sp. S.PNR 29 TaxID=2973805 RepID=UPI0025AF81B9|nr:hypothetical protein [Streptomyces sp. S.PNR 29]MDN0195170.1 hypothetical protein [Streptomyces sp. S.PNR 29]
MAMVRYVHDELRDVFSALAASAVNVAVMVSVRGFSPVRPSGLALLAGLALAFLAVYTLLRSSRLKWFSGVKQFEAAVPVEDTDAALPTGDSLRRHPIGLRLFAACVAMTLPLALLWDSWMAVFPLWPALAWLGRAVVCARWERRHGRLVWRGHLPEEPWELSVSRRPPTRTATDAPPA